MAAQISPATKSENAHMRSLWLNAVLLLLMLFAFARIAHGAWAQKIYGGMRA